jgi:hypothetical protein
LCPRTFQMPPNELDNARVSQVGLRDLEHRRFLGCSPPTLLSRTVDNDQRRACDGIRASQITQVSTQPCLAPTNQADARLTMSMTVFLLRPTLRAMSQ